MSTGRHAHTTENEKQVKGPKQKHDDDGCEGQILPHAMKRRSRSDLKSAYASVYLGIDSGRHGLWLKNR